jgi:uncharacterized protein YbjQ (UPF0145 family)
MRIGEPVKCRSCETEPVVPEDAAEADESEARLALEDLKGGVQEITPTKSQVDATGQEPVTRILITTAPVLQDRRILRYLGVVSAEVILEPNLLADLIAKLKDTFGGRLGAYEKTVGEAKNAAIVEMSNAALSQGANAVIAVSFDYETIGENALMVAVSGTAVLYQQEEIG